MTYNVTVEQVARLCRDFQADCHDGFVSNDESYIELQLKKLPRRRNADLQPLILCQIVQCIKYHGILPLVKNQIRVALSRPTTTLKGDLCPPTRSGLTAFSVLSMTEFVVEPAEPIQSEVRRFDEVENLLFHGTDPISLSSHLLCDLIRNSQQAVDITVK